VEKLKILESKSLLFFKKHPELLDIVLFGSFRKGKEHPEDADVILLFKEKKNFDVLQEYRRLVESALKMEVDALGKSYAELFDSSFLARTAFLSEGYSLVRKRSISESLGYEAKILFTYNLQGKSKSERMRFYYSLYGRNSVGMLNKLKAEKYTDTVILCPTSTQTEMREFLTSWKVEFKEKSVLMLK